MFVFSSTSTSESSWNGKISYKDTGGFVYFITAKQKINWGYIISKYAVHQSPNYRINVKHKLQSQIIIT